MAPIARRIGPLGSLVILVVVLAVVLGNFGLVVQILGWTLGLSLALFGMTLLRWFNRRRFGRPR